MIILRKTWLLLVGVILIAVGYVLLARVELTAGPLLLVLGYCIALPVFIWHQFRQGGGE
ncbi:hypothetical protein GF314_02910 [bacterium]|nr:hypothetical protein [bacterium]